MNANVITLTAPAQPARYIVLDIETGDAPEEAIIAATEGWKAPGNWKPETVEAKRQDAAERIRDKAALLDASPILCIGLRTDSDARVFNGMGDPGPLFQLTGWSAEHHPDERAMLVSLSTWLNAHTDPSTILVGHNVRGFDLPKMRGAYVRNRLPLPMCLRPVMDGPGQPITDTMHLFKSYSMENRDNPFVGLDTVCRTFGIPRPKSVISGADIPRFHKDGRIAEILIYLSIDVEATTEIYRLMMQ